MHLYFFYSYKEIVETTLIISWVESRLENTCVLSGTNIAKYIYRSLNTVDSTAPDTLELGIRQVRLANIMRHAEVLNLLVNQKLEGFLLITPCLFSWSII